MEGASWHLEDGFIAESRPAQLFWPMPLVWMDPVTLEHAPNADEGGLYKVWMSFFLAAVFGLSIFLVPSV